MWHWRKFSPLETEVLPKMYISLQIRCLRVPGVSRDMEQNTGVTWAGGEGSEADCYTVLVHNLNINTLCRRKSWTLTGLNDKERFIVEQCTVCTVCLHCCFGPSGWSEDIHGKAFVTQKTRPTWYRLPACRWRNHSLEIQNYPNTQLYCCVPMNTDCLAQPKYWTVMCGTLLSWWDKQRRYTHQLH